LLYCLQATGLRLADIDLVAVSGTGANPPEPGEPGLHHLGVDQARILPVDHHLAHAYSAYCLSGFEEAIVMVIDGAGNHGDTETWYAATPGQVTRAGGNDPARPRCGGIGATYEAFTNYLGWHEQEAGKTMALAAYGNPGAYPDPLFDTSGTTITGRLRRTHEHGVTDLAARTGWDFGPPGSRGGDPRGTDAAAYLQAQTTQALCTLAGNCVVGTGLPDLCLAGGVALNCVAADQVRRLPGVRGYFAPPPASDRGQAFGCALIGWHRLTGQLPRRPLAADSLGRPYTDVEIEQALRRDPRSGLVERRRARYAWRRESDIAATAAQMIAAGKLVGWFQGGSELGPRALGQRSILADPRTSDSAAALNARVKHREPFRPFAPAILAGHAGDWFDLDVPSPYMLLAPPVRPAKAGQLAAVVHVDGTARVQTVHEAASPRLAALLSEFLRITGVPAVLNTSFNDREPIVETPAHALATFQDTSLDALCIGDYLAEKA
ncbi:MAG: carbamoyltransferase C-terminal domain-containing protein, partial [Trebonia sp.]